MQYPVFNNILNDCDTGAESGFIERNLEVIKICDRFFPGNSVCRQIPWDTNAEYLSAWKEARTGYPFIDAIMTQLRREGWIHHLARSPTQNPFYDGLKM
jgi:hypothetical protein